jgi:hypothetical protein
MPRNPSRAITEMLILRLLGYAYCKDTTMQLDIFQLDGFFSTKSDVASSESEMTESVTSQLDDDPSSSEFYAQQATWAVRKDNVLWKDFISAEEISMTYMLFCFFLFEL